MSQDPWMDDACSEMFFFFLSEICDVLHIITFSNSERSTAKVAELLGTVEWKLQELFICISHPKTHPSHSNVYSLLGLNDG